MAEAYNDQVRYALSLADAHYETRKPQVLGLALNVLRSDSVSLGIVPTSEQMEHENAIRANAADGLIGELKSVLNNAAGEADVRQALEGHQARLRNRRADNLAGLSRHEIHAPVQLYREFVTKFSDSLGLGR